MLAPCSGDDEGDEIRRAAAETVHARGTAEALRLLPERVVDARRGTTSAQGRTDIIAVRPPPCLEQGLTESYQVIPPSRCRGRIVKHTPEVRFGSDPIGTAGIDVQRHHVQKPADVP